MKKIVFVKSLAESHVGEKYIDLSSDFISENSDNDRESVDLSTLYSQFGKKWVEDFSELLSKLNQNNASLLWWAYTSTAKNLLSSPLGERYIQIQAICELITRKDIDTLNVIGATTGQMESIISNLSDSNIKFGGNALKFRLLKKIAANSTALIRQAIHCGRLFFGFFGCKAPIFDKHIDLCLFTYLDGGFHKKFDNYFGELPQLLQENNYISSFLYLAYVYTPYRQRIKNIRSPSAYVALFSLLSLSDYYWAFSKTFLNWWKNAFQECSYKFGSTKKYSSLFNEIFLHDIAVGSYLHNLLIYKSICKFIKVCEPKTFIYPYENKSLEKMILIGINDAEYKPVVMGFQHSSITPRHITLLFRPEEATYTPLPDKIITVGKITREYLEQFGNYPPEIFITGCALRQKRVAPMTRPNYGDNKIRVLLALSSSEQELLKSVMLFQKVMRLMPELELGIRCHINFPLTLLPKDIAVWAKENTLDFSGTKLNDNLSWSNVTAYVSSTVAIETLMQGKPVVNISIGDMVSSDPVIGGTSFHWHAGDEIEMVETLSLINNISDADYGQYSSSAVSYAEDYLRPINNVCLEKYTGDSKNT